ncbi:hypothetical protein [Methanosarcina sp. KYL-1]|uniref:hypothetical protein n=1 Tax=Methanosarcina sp. KYL-1 TaxID=2602068 RepID=UPI0021015E28|nr:hypothetical protein [Methanosarcina sp. KYL-1]
MKRCMHYLKSLNPETLNLEYDYERRSAVEKKRYKLTNRHLQKAPAKKTYMKFLNYRHKK